MHKPREKVPEKYWEEAKNPFKNVLAELKPDVVLCIGYETFEHLPEGGSEEKEISISNEDEYSEI